MMYVRTDIYEIAPNIKVILNPSFEIVLSIKSDSHSFLPYCRMICFAKSNLKKKLLNTKINFQLFKITFQPLKSNFK